MELDAKEQQQADVAKAAGRQQEAAAAAAGCLGKPLQMLHCSSATLRLRCA